MSEQTLILICWIWMAIAIAVHITMFFVTAPFGRHTSDKWGISINNKTGWIVMELPSLLIMSYYLITGSFTFLNYSWILFLFWMGHYVHRTLIYPFRIKSTPKKMPVLIVLNAIIFNVINAGLNGFFLAEFSNGLYDESWLSSWNFLSGLIVFFTGAYINVKSDSMLIRLRAKGETDYKIPKGFLFEYVSSPNLMGEILEWGGFALMAWNLPALTFFVWTYANLVPRAKNHHDWYLNYFDYYPKKRKIIFPFVY